MNFQDEDVIFTYDRSQSLVTHTNVITTDYINYIENIDRSLVSAISYSRNINMNILYQTDALGYDLTSTQTSTAFNEMPNSKDFIEAQYDVLSGYYPETYNELALIIDSSNQIDLSLLESLGITVYDDYTFDDFLGMTFTVIPNDVFYTETNGIYVPQTHYDTMYQSNDAITIEIVGIMRVNPDASSEILSTGIGYTTALTDYMLDLESTSNLVVAQTNSPETNVLTGLPFSTQLSYNDIMKLIGGDSTPTGIQIYPLTFDAKDEIKTYLDQYNENLAVEDQLIYTDLAELISDTISSLISTITLILTAFAAISLVVSSIMIGIITYVSVVERTKEIGIMRSLGARKKDISRIFNAETLMIGLASGLLGIGVAFVLNIPINVIVNNLIGVENIAALTLYHAGLLIVLSTVLTFIAGLIPSRIAAKKDPVVALRTE